jgi:hypothetical protein
MLEILYTITGIILIISIYCIAMYRGEGDEDDQQVYIPLRAPMIQPMHP